MSALGHKRTFRDAGAMSALPPKADIRRLGRNVRFVPIADSCAAANSLFDHLVGALKQWRRDSEAQRLGGLEIDDKLDFGRKFHRQVAGFGAL
jgi:hypothetical protein